jgi:hypothetical protein
MAGVAIGGGERSECIRVEGAVGLGTALLRRARA